MSCFYLKLMLGWLFHLPSFPTDLFYSVVIENVSDDATLRVGLDSYEVVHETVLYTVCPFLNEINVILRENTSCNVKHIRPVTAQSDSMVTSQHSKQLEVC